MRLLLIVLSLLLVPSLTAGTLSFQQETVRVALLKGSDSVRFDGNGILATDDTGEPLRTAFPLEVRRSKGGVSVNGRTFKGIKLSAPGFVVANGKGYRGVLEVSAADKGILVVNELPLEEYLVGLINCEISSQWPMEAVKAQAVIARSYAIFQKEARKNAVYHLESTILDQVYEGCDIEDSRASRAVKETAGVVLTYNSSVIQAFYHSNCGGHTEASENVWGYSLPYMQGAVCNYCRATNPYRWDQKISLKKIESQLKAAGFNVSGLRDIRAGAKNRSGRLSEVVLTTSRGRVTVPGSGFRKALGFNIIKSTNFEVRVVDDEAIFNGTGYGHGVGLCQWGAKSRAADGFDYREILAYYYPGTRLMNLSGD